MPKQLRGLQALAAGAVVALAVSLTACDRDRQPLVLPYVFEQDVVLAFGDSLTYGSGARREESYPAVLGSLIARDVVNAGVPGEVTGDGLKRLAGALKEHEPTLVLLCLGGNDFLRKKPPAATERNLSAMLDLVKSEQTAVVLIAVPRPGLSLKADPLYEKLAQQHNVLLVKDLMADVLGDKSLKSDAIHPNARGYRQIAEALAEVLDRHGAI